jgi:hypothetical protein
MPIPPFSGRNPFYPPTLAHPGFLAMATYLSVLSEMLRARELEDESEEDKLLDELDALWAKMSEAQRTHINKLSTELAKGTLSIHDLGYLRHYEKRVGPDLPYCRSLLLQAWARRSRTSRLIKQKVRRSGLHYHTDRFLP